ncbi:hypothetical protein OAK75_01745 [Bacteriovoracales bacterium]|nr:hypothetical protein [Bacteriovoracales bacterium]
MYKTLYLWWIYVDGTRTTSAVRNFAKLEAHKSIDKGFVTLLFIKILGGTFLSSFFSHVNL